MSQRVLITGGTRGVGLAIVARLKTEGYAVIATGRKSTPELEALAASGDGPGSVQFRELELSRHEGFQSFIAGLVADGGPLYGLVNNAAMGLDGVLATMHDSQIAQLVNVNVLGTILLTKYAHRSMLARREGRIVNTLVCFAKMLLSVMSDKNGMPLAPISVPSASKVALARAVWESPIMPTVCGFASAARTLAMVCSGCCLSSKN